MLPSLDQLVQDAGGSDPHRATRAAARLMSVMANQPQRLAELLAGSRDWPEPRLVLGLTGPPGCGKSTLTDHLVAEYRSRYSDRRVGVIAVDPSSPFTGGAVLGDRVRMMRHATDPQVFIRSLASRGHLGGLTLGARGVVRVMGLLGCDVVIIETVGVGQSEVEVAQHADVVMVAMAPGLGDSIQLLKAGLMEAGELFVINKADREGASQLYSQMLAVLKLGRTAAADLAHHIDGAPCADALVSVSGREPRGELPVFLVSATNHEGIGELVDHLEKVAAVQGPRWRARRQAQIETEVREAVLEAVRQRVDRAMGTNGHADPRVRQVLQGQLSLEQLTDQLMRESLRDAQERANPEE